MFIDVDANFFEYEEEFRVREAEHAERSLVFEPLFFSRTFGRSQIRDLKGDFFLQRHDFQASCGADGQTALEEIDGVCFAWDVEFIEVAEELGGSLFEAEAGS